LAFNRDKSCQELISVARHFTKATPHATNAAITKFLEKGQVNLNYETIQNIRIAIIKKCRDAKTQPDELFTKVLDRITEYKAESSQNKAYQFLAVNEFPQTEQRDKILATLSEGFQP
jgi:hypothetical protein